MGKIVYGNPAIEVVIDDRVMAHLQIVIGAKLRRKESFFFSWRDDKSVGDGRSSIWMNDAIPLYFKYLESKAPLINRAWIAALMESSNSPTGLRLAPEPDSDDPPPSLPRSNV